MSIDSQDDFDGLQRAGRAVANALLAMEAAVAVGMTTADIDDVGATVLRAAGARSAPQIVYGFPGFNLISVNDEIVHGIPNNRRIEADDVVKLDVTAELDGYIADAATTVVVAPASLRRQRLGAAAKRAFADACGVARAGALVSEIGRAVEGCVKREGFAIIRPLTGHGVGRTIHEPPSVPNFFDPYQRDVLSEGLVITVEPIIAQRPCRVVHRGDGWTLATNNGTLAAHYEHTIIVTRGEPLVLTA